MPSHANRDRRICARIPSELSGKIVHLDDDSANTGDKKVVTEHCRNRDAERGDCRDERAGYTGRHRDEVRRTSFGHAGERIHHAPDGAEQAEKWRTTYRGCEQNHLRFKRKRCLADSTLHRGVYRTHLCRRNFIRDPQSRPKGIIHLGRPEQMKCHFLAASAIHIEYWRSGKARIFLE